MAAPPSYQAPFSTASLANNTSGTTFAAKARAAELNAVRSRKAAQELEVENEVPSTAPVALGALKFTRPRTRGKGWKSMALGELPEESTRGEEFHIQGTPKAEEFGTQSSHERTHHNPEVVEHGFIQNNKENLPTRYHSNVISTVSFQESIDPQPSNSQNKVGKLRANDHDSDGSLARLTGHESYSQSQIGNLTPLRSSQSSTNNQNSRFTQKPEADDNLKPAQYLHDESYKANESESDHRLQLTFSEEKKLKNLGVLPSLRTDNTKTYLKQRTTEDPFVEKVQTTHANLYSPYIQQDQKGVSSFKSLEGPLPPPPAEAMEHRFRFPSSYQTRVALSQHSATKPQQERTCHADVSSKVVPYQRDPMPYSSFSMGDKKDMLLQNLHQVVESSKGQGNLSESTRTVLHDPVTHDSGELSSETVLPNTVRGQVTLINSAASDKESLKASDPLPWTNRPVDIQDTASPLVPLSTIPPSMDLPTNQMPQPGVLRHNAEVWAIAPQPSNAKGSLEDVELWFMKDAQILANVHPKPDQTSTSYQVDEKSTQFYHENARHDGHSQNSKGRGLASPFTPEASANGDMIRVLMGQVFQNLASYLEPKQDYFGRYARVPEWCIDKLHGGDQSFFGDWGAWGLPPSRVGRDPRYAQTLHEGRFTVFEELERRGRDALGRRLH